MKPENILINPKTGIIKVIDFGTSQLFDGDHKYFKKVYGTSYYIAPEVMQGKYTAKCDLWSIGVILYIMLCGLPPFNGGTDDEIMQKVKIGKYNFNHKPFKLCSDESKDLIKQLLQYSPKDRLDAQQALEHPWVKHSLNSKKVDQEVV